MSTLLSTIFLCCGLTLLVAFGYFATLWGIESAFHGPSILLALGALIFGAVYANARPRPTPSQIAKANALGSRFRSLSTKLAVASAIMFFVEVNLPSLASRVALGALSLFMYAVSFLLGSLNRSSNER